MAAVWLCVRHELRRRWRGVVVLGVLLGVAGAVVMTAAASARRTSSAYERLLRTSDAFDVEVQITGEADPSILERVAALPQVAEHGRIAFIPSTAATREPSPFAWDITSVALVDANIGRTMEIPKMTAGHFPRADAPHDVMVNETFATSKNVGVGDTFTLQLPTFEELFELFGGAHPIPTGPVVTVRITGIGRIPHDVSISEPTGIMILTPAFFRTYSDRAAHLWAMEVRLHKGDADVAAFVRDGKEIAREAAGSGAEEEILSFRSNIEARTGVERALGVQSFALWIFAAIVGAAGLLVLGQGLGRWQAIGADDQEILRSLGMGRFHLTAASALPIAFVALGSAALAVVTSFLVSPFVPIAFARQIDPQLGFFADATVWVAGAAAIVIVIVLWAWLRALVFARRARGDTTAATAQPSAAADLAARNGLPAPVVAGVRFGLEPGRGRSAVPVRSVLAGTALAITAVAGALVFGRSLDHMLATPATYGWNFDLVAFGGDDDTFVADLERKLDTSSNVAEFSRVSIQTTTFRGRDLETLGVEPLKGSVLPVVLDGRFPRRADEVALASRTLREARVPLGDHITLPAPNDACPVPPCDARFRVVGKVIHWGEGHDSDDGAAFTEAGQARVRTSAGFVDYLVRVPVGSDRRATIRALEREIGDTQSPFSSDEERGSGILGSNLRNVHRVRAMPAILSTVLGVLALVTLVHALLMTARRRRFDLAVLKTLGFVRHQVASTVAWQATTLVLLALAVGVPVGIVAGRWTWTALASRLGVAEVHDIAAPWLAAGAVGTLVLANLISLIPGRTAARTQPALVLRTE